MKKKFCLMQAAALLLSLVLIAGASAASVSSPLHGYSSDTGYTYVSFGSYPQWIDGGNPPDEAWNWSRNKLLDNPPVVKPSPILWRVLDAGEDQALLLSEYVLFAHPVHTNVTEYKSLGKHFADTQLSLYLNGEFLESAFTEKESALLIPDEDGRRVTLLTAAQLKSKALGLGTDLARKAWATEYAIRVTNVFVYRIAVGQHTPYWLQEQASSDARHARCIKQSGAIGHIVADRDNEGARPVVILNLAAASIQSGSGTMSDPYILSISGQN